jgi:hypothetical protein
VFLNDCIVCHSYQQAKRAPISVCLVTAILLGRKWYWFAFPFSYVSWSSFAEMSLQMFSPFHLKIQFLFNWHTKHEICTYDCSTMQCFNTCVYHVIRLNIHLLKHRSLYSENSKILLRYTVPNPYLCALAQWNFSLLSNCSKTPHLFPSLPLPTLPSLW